MECTKHHKITVIGQTLITSVYERRMVNVFQRLTLLILSLAFKCFLATNQPKSRGQDSWIYHVQTCDVTIILKYSINIVLLIILSLTISPVTLLRSRTSVLYIPHPIYSNHSAVGASCSRGVWFAWF